MFSIGARGRSLGGQTPVRAISRQGAAAAAEQAVRPLTPDAARRLLLSGQPPERLTVNGPLRLSGSARLRELPRVLVCTTLDVSDCPALSAFPEWLRAGSVRAARTAVRELSGDWLVQGSLDLSGNRALACLPERLSCGPLDLSDCPRLSALPAGLHLNGPLEVAGSGLTGLPSGLRPTLTWRGVPVDERTALRPEALRAQDILNMRNVTRRRVALDRFGLERFVEALGGLVLDRDRDAGGERRLVCLPLEGDEPIVALCVRCPSTGHACVLRVPPQLRSCRRAAAWLAGFEHERDYQPLQEA